MRKNLISKIFFTFACLIILFLSSCKSSPEFIKLDSGAEYRFVEQYPDSVQSKPGDIWILNVKYFNASDSLLFDSKLISDVFKMSCPTVDMTGSVEQVLNLMHKGDSAVIVVDARKFYKESCGFDTVPSFIKPDERLTFYVRCLNIITAEQFNRELDQLNIKMKASENLLIHQYLEYEGLTAQPSASGLYKIVTREGTGTETADSKFITIDYKGMLINGFEFDNSYKRNKPLQFQLGRHQVIPGWEEGVSTMKKGEKATLIIPFDLAYGAAGYSDLIPPYSTLIFEVELIDFK